MRLVVLGGSAPSTPLLVDCLNQAACAEPIEIVLAGRTKDSTLAVARAARILAGDGNVCIHWTTTEGEDWQRQLEGADVVLLQARIGGYSGRLFDETFPLKYGICGDQALGPGGVSAAWRAWPEVRRLVAAIGGTCPNALVLVVSAPLGIMVRLVKNILPRQLVVGICELPWTTLQNLTQRLNANLARVDFDYVGVNHLGWFYRLQERERNLICEYLGQKVPDAVFPSRSLVSNLNAFPLSYLRLHYFPFEVAAEQRLQADSRVNFLIRFKEKSLNTYRFGNAADIRGILSERSAPWYSQAIAPFVLAWLGNRSDRHFFLTLPCDGVVHELSSEDLVELACSVENARVIPKPLSTDNTLSSFLELLKLFVAFERRASSAVEERNGLADALALHPWVRGHAIARQLAEEIQSSS